MPGSPITEERSRSGEAGRGREPQGRRRNTAGTAGAAVWVAWGEGPGLVRRILPGRGEHTGEVGGVVKTGLELFTYEAGVAGGDGPPKSIARGMALVYPWPSPFRYSTEASSILAYVLGA